MPGSQNPARSERECVLYVNDTPTRRANGGVDGGYVYNDKRHVIAVSFVARNGRAIRVNFDPQTGDVSTFELEH